MRKPLTEFKHQNMLESSNNQTDFIGVNVFDGTEILCKELVIWKILILVFRRKIGNLLSYNNNAKVEIGLSTNIT